jgi:hypothetical protein
MSAPLIRPTSGLATAAMILGVASLFSCGLTSIPAIVTGHLATGETKTGERAGHGMAVAGLILGYLCAGGWALFWILSGLGMALGSTGTGTP